ncbi:MAG: hypothetical protein IJM90_08025 [Firmicutes bacterium]|nr:hypothetical protein [Bacillota bacterium]
MGVFGSINRARDEENTARIEALQQENGKLRQELEAYREREQAIAQREREAEAKAAAMVEEAECRAEERLAAARREREQIRRQALRMQEKMQEFQSEFDRLVRDYLTRARTEEFPALFNRLGAYVEELSGSAPDNTDGKE